MHHLDDYYPDTELHNVDHMIIKQSWDFRGRGKVQYKSIDPNTVPSLLERKLTDQLRHSFISQQK